MPTRLVPAFLMLCLLPMPGCTPSDSTTPPAAPPPAEAPATADPDASPPKTTTYTAEGTVRSVTPSGRYVMIRHEDIPGFMHAMTMPFEVADALSVDHLERDHRIRFTFEASATNHVLTNITLLED